jgi:hypothetical protein
MGILLCKIQILVIFLAENGKEGPMSEGVRHRQWQIVDSWKGTHLGLRISLLRFAWMSHDLYMTLRNISPIGMVLTQGCSYIPARLWPFVNCGDRLETMCVEETPCISGGIELKCTRSERRRVAISYRRSVRILSENEIKNVHPVIRSS